MGIGATPISRTKQLNNGSMGVGSNSAKSVPKSEGDIEKDLETKVAQPEVENEVENESQEGDNEVEGSDENETDFTKMHHSKLKKIAVEKGYTGDKFDKQTLLEFLTTKNDESNA